MHPCVSSPASPVPVPTLQLPDTGFLRERQVLAFVPISKSTLWRRAQERAFPAPVSCRRTSPPDGRRTCGWIQEQGRQVPT
jgi:prophage regulatory protein